MSEDGLEALVQSWVARLRRQGDDDERVEAKSVARSLGKEVWPTVSAFANTGGGVVLLGLDEREGFRPAPDFDIARVSDQLMSGLDEAQGADPKVKPVPEYRLNRLEFEGGQLLVLRISPMRHDPGLISLMPCHVVAQGLTKGSYKRVLDADKRMSAYEIHQLQTLTRRDENDRSPAHGAHIDDLDEALISDFLRALEASGSKAAEGVGSRREILERMNIVLAEGAPTLAGILTFGRYPQQFFPQLFIDVTVHPGSEKSQGHSDVRFLDRRMCDGPIPVAVDDAVRVVFRNLRVRHVERGTGAVDEPEIPRSVIREAICNAVMHRHYGPDVQGQQVAVDVFTDRVEITNPGGLWGDRTLENLRDGRSVSRNPILSQLLSRAPLPGGQGTVSENQGSGIRRMFSGMQHHGLPAPRFHADIGSFTVVLSRFGLMNQETTDWLERFGGGRSRVQDIALILAHDLGAVTPRELREHLGIDSDDARADLQRLAHAGKLVESSPDRFTIPLSALGVTGKAEQVLRLLSASTPKNIREISAESGSSVNSLRPVLKELVEGGFVVATAPPTSRRRAYLLA